ncbi:MAG: NAD(P)/FAD-dependent oxidoreductase [bacterium]|nr:NAD(P)/FAD-dependent oxidoreductase [bacterium]
MESYDVIVIGAGNGGLTAGATLAKQGAKTLVLERHNVPGGCGTSFCRGRFEFEVALHQLSGLGRKDQPGPLRSVLDALGVLEKLEFVEMEDLYRVTVPGQMDITLLPDKEKAVAELQKQFPTEKENIVEFFDLVYQYFTEVIKAFVFKDPDVTPEKYPAFFKYSLKSAGEVLDQFFTDPLIKVAVGIYWTYLGVPPRLMTFGDLAGLLFMYMEFKPFHLKGGSQTLSNAIAEEIFASGGMIRYNTGVKKIIVEDGAVKGVITDSGETIKAPYVVSNASKITTYVDLIGKENIPEKTISELKGGTIGPSAFTLYIGLDCKPEEIGIKDSTNFICLNTDMDQAFEQMDSIETKGNSMLLTCYNHVDPSFSPEGTSQIAIVLLKNGDPWLRIPTADYAKEKYRLAEDLIATAEKVFPGLRDHIEEIEIATPITHLRYLGHPRGAIYGFSSLAKDSNMFITPRQNIKGLFGAGSWFGLGGFQPTLESGASTGRAVMKKLRQEGGK